MRLVFIRVFSSEGSGREVPVHSSVWAQRRSVGSVCLFRHVSGVSHGPGLSLLRIPPGAPPAQPDSSGWAWAPSLTSDREDATAPSALPPDPHCWPPSAESPPAGRRTLSLSGFHCAVSKQLLFSFPSPVLLESFLGERRHWCTHSFLCPPSQPFAHPCTHLPAQPRTIYRPPQPLST